MSQSELRNTLEAAFDAGDEWGRLVALEGSWDTPNFDEWYEEVYGSADCE